jgi:hypothetical protein
MNFKALAALGGIAILGAGGVILGLGDKDGTGDVAAADPVRAVRLPGACPVPPALEAAKCASTVQGDGWCLCFTSQKPGQVDDEVTDVSGKPAKDRARLVACTVKVDGKDQIVTRWEKSDAAVQLTCTVAAADVLMPNLSANGLELGDTEAKLRESCAPCQVTAGHWGLCPACLRMPGGCAAACPPPPDGGPK